MYVCMSLSMHYLGQFSNRSKCMCIIHCNLKYYVAIIRLRFYGGNTCQDLQKIMSILFTWGWLRKFYESFSLHFISD